MEQTSVMPAAVRSRSLGATHASPNGRPRSINIMPAILSKAMIGRPDGVVYGFSKVSSTRVLVGRLLGQLQIDRVARSRVAAVRSRSGADR